MHNWALIDLGFDDHVFTWCNRHEGFGLVLERLDRFIATPAVKTMFPSLKVQHLSFFGSDHRAIFLDMEPRPRQRRKGPRIQRFEQVWLRDDDCDNILASNWNGGGHDPHDKAVSCLSQMSRWANKRFGDVPRKIEEVKRGLDELYGHEEEAGVLERIRRLEVRLDDLLESEEIWCAQRSRAMWLQHGDKNSKFFHQKASQRK